MACLVDACLCRGFNEDQIWALICATEQYIKWILVSNKGKSLLVGELYQVLQYITAWIKGENAANLVNFVVLLLDIEPV